MVSAPDAPGQALGPRGSRPFFMNGVREDPMGIPVGIVAPFLRGIPWMLPKVRRDRSAWKMEPIWMEMSMGEVQIGMNQNPTSGRSVRVSDPHPKSGSVFLGHLSALIFLFPTQASKPSPNAPPLWSPARRLRPSAIRCATYECYGIPPRHRQGTLPFLPMAPLAFAHFF